jgi:hypothetical protein
VSGPVHGPKHGPTHAPEEALLLVGSVPLDSAAEVFRDFGEPLGAYLKYLPDGETGPRSHWVSRLHYQVFALHQDLEVLRRPRLDNGIERLNPHDPSDGWQFRLKPGVEKFALGNPGWRLGFARDALNSFALFQALQQSGKLPERLRFQVSMPMVNSVVGVRTFPVAGDLEKIRAGYLASLQSELDTILAKIPPDKLAIQWDCASETLDASRTQSLAGIERNLSQVYSLSPRIPAQVALGYHFCFGTLGTWPSFAPDTLDETIKLANAYVEASERRVDYLHIPSLDRDDDAYFAPLANLKPRGARVYLGVVHNMQRYARRVAAARKFIADFGVGAFCGFGRERPADLPRILSEHLTALQPPR